MTVEGRLQHDTADRRLWGTPYRTLRQRFRDGMAEVVSAERLSTGQSVDVTILAMEAVAHQTTMDQLRHQGDRVRLAGDVLRKLRHPNVAAVLDAGETPDGRPYFVTEDLPKSRTVLEILGAGPLPLAEAISIALDILSALDAAHHLGVLHRDIKPTNVLVAHEGDTRVVKLMGFGIAKVIAEGQSGVQPLSTPTAADDVLVPPRYVTPEIVLGQPLDVRSDVYQLGLLLFEMIAGRAPFNTDGTTRSWIMSHVSVPPITLRDLDAAPHAVSEVVGKALAKDPTRRWRSAAAFAEALRACVDTYLEPADREQLRQVGAGGTDLIDRSDLVSLIQRSGSPGDHAPTAKFTALTDPLLRPKRGTKKPAESEASSPPATVSQPTRDASANAPEATAAQLATAPATAPEPTAPPTPHPTKNEAERASVAGVVTLRYTRPHLLLAAGLLLLVFVLGWLVARYTG